MNFAIIVTFNPKWSHIEKMVCELLSADVKPVIYDNTPEPKVDKVIDGAVIIGQKGNLGIAQAFNASIEYCRTYQSKDVKYIFFDQDSTFKHTDVKELFIEHAKLEKENIPVGVLGAKALMSNNEPYPLRAAKGPKVDGAEHVWFVMSSFSIISDKVLMDLGGFKGEFFIDLVDSEFSFRCTKNGLYNLISQSVKFAHVVGEERKKFGKTSFSISSPIRNYYQTRNMILVGMEYRWYGYILKMIIKRFLLFSYSGLHENNLLLRYKYMFFGLIDGFRRKGGIYHR